MSTVAETVVQALSQAGVRRLYGVVGDSLNSVVDAVRRHPGIDWIQVRHEEVGAFAAGAEAQLSGQLAACAGSCGPGNLHLINGLYDCHRSAVPVVAIAAHIPTSEIGTDFFQETHPERLFVECSHYCELVSSPSQTPRAIEIAVETALGKRGVSVIVLPGDVAMQAARDASGAFNIPVRNTEIRPTDQDLDGLAQLLNASRKTTLLCGRGCAGAHSQVMELAARLKSPIVHSLRGKEHLEYANPYDVGMTGLIGFPSGYRAMETCDVLLMLGTDFPYRDFYPKHAKIVQIDIRPEHLGRRAHLDLGLVGGVAETLQALLPKLTPKTDTAHLDDALKHYQKTRQTLGTHVKGLANQRPIHPEYLTTIVDELASSDAIFTVDTGLSTVWAARYLKMTEGRRLIGSFVHGSMANALPQAIGAQLLHPSRQVVSLSGDGGLAMLMGDLLTVTQHELPVKIIVYNNSALGMVKLEMQVAGLPDYGTDFNPVNFAKLAEAAGMYAVRVENPSDIRKAVEEAFRHNGPALVDVVTSPLVLPMPPKVTSSQARGFSLFLLKETLGGHFGETISEIETNLR